MTNTFSLKRNLWRWAFLTTSVFVISACAIPYARNPPVFETKPEAMQHLPTVTHVPKLEWYLVANTGSMEPFLTGGMYVLVDLNFPFEKIVVDDVMLYRAKYKTQGDRPICHRANYIDAGGIIASGDANPEYERGDFRVTKVNFIGKVIAVVNPLLNATPAVNTN